jgi:hypothetical protein
MPSTSPALDSCRRDVTRRRKVILVDGEMDLDTLDLLAACTATNNLDTR